jgi:hypothetical protein
MSTLVTTVPGVAHSHTVNLILTAHCAGLSDVQGASQCVISADTAEVPGKLKVIT